MYVPFLLIYFGGLAYVLVAYRRINVFAIAYCGCCVYFTPGVVGWVTDPSQLRSESLAARSVPLTESTYAAMAVVLISTLLFTVLYDRLGQPERPCHSFQDASGVMIGYAALGLTLIGFVLSYLSSGRSLFALDKSDVLASLTRWHILATSASCVAAGFLFRARRLNASLLLSAAIAFDVFIGMRSTVVMVILIYILLSFRDMPRQRLLIAQPSWIALCGSIGIVVISYKQIYGFVKQGQLSVAIGHVLDVNEIVDGLRLAEPFVTEAILNEVLRRDIRVGPLHVLDQFLQSFTLFGRDLGLADNSFNQLVVKGLFGPIDFGLANNIWAQMYSAGGFGFLFAFVIVWNLQNWIFATAIDRGTPFWSKAAAIMAPWWIFYIHRNDLAYTLNLEKRQMLALLLSFAIAACWHSFRERHSLRGLQPAFGRGRRDSSRSRSSADVRNVFLASTRKPGNVYTPSKESRLCDAQRPVEWVAITGFDLDSDGFIPDNAPDGRVPGMGSA